LAEEKKKLTKVNVWREARTLVWAHRHRLALGLVLLAINRVVALVLPYSSKILIDDIVGKKQPDLIPMVAIAIAVATIVQAISSFVLSQILGVAAQRAITDMRKSIQEHVARLPVRYFDSTQTGVLISRIMNDAEGIRNLVGSGLVQVIGGLVTSVAALAVLFYLNWQLTAAILVVLLIFGACMALTFKKLRPIFRERSKINAEVTGRLGESIGGIRVVKAYTAEKREHLVFSKGAHRLFRNVAKSMTGVSAATGFSTVVIGLAGILMVVIGGNALLAGTMTPGDLLMYLSLTLLLAAPVVQIASIGTQISEAFAGLDRIHELKSMAAEDADDPQRSAVTDIRGEIAFENITFEYNPGVPVLKNVSFKAPSG
jgi:ABC-type multidrug transport system fused ATPase/permease subunit